MLIFSPKRLLLLGQFGQIIDVRAMLNEATRMAAEEGVSSDVSCHCCFSVCVCVCVCVCV